MKNFLFITCILFNVLGFTQEQSDKTQPLFISNINIGDFGKVYSDLDKVTNSITSNNFSIKRIDDIRQGQLIISTENIGKSLKNIKINMRPSLNVEVQRIMFTGNFLNPRQPGVIRIK